MRGYVSLYRGVAGGMGGSGCLAPSLCLLERLIKIGTSDFFELSLRRDDDDLAAMTPSLLTTVGRVDGAFEGRRGGGCGRNVPSGVDTTFLKRRPLRDLTISLLDVIFVVLACDRRFVSPGYCFDYCLMSFLSY